MTDYDLAMEAVWDLAEQLGSYVFILENADGTFDAKKPDGTVVPFADLVAAGQALTGQTAATTGGAV